MSKCVSDKGRNWTWKFITILASIFLLDLRLMACLIVVGSQFRIGDLSDEIRIEWVVLWVSTIVSYILTVYFPKNNIPCLYLSWRTHHWERRKFKTESVPSYICQNFEHFLSSWLLFKTQRSRDCILTSSSGGTYSVWPHRQRRYGDRD
jgi:hypothetical protein